MWVVVRCAFGRTRAAARDARDARAACNVSARAGTARGVEWSACFWVNSAGLDAPAPSCRLLISAFFTRSPLRGGKNHGLPALLIALPRAGSPGVTPRFVSWRRSMTWATSQSPSAPSSQLHTTAAHHRITREVARGTRDARAAGVRARATRWRRAPYVTGGSSSRGLGDKTLQLRPFFPIAYHHHTPPPRRSIEGGATRGIGGDPAGDVGTSGALPDTRGTHRWWPILLRFGGTAVFDDARRCVVPNGIPPVADADDESAAPDG